MNCKVADLIVRVMNVEYQQSGHACGLLLIYAIAIAVNLCFRNDPYSSYDEEKIRNHSELCFDKQVITQFPQQLRNASHRILKKFSLATAFVVILIAQHALVIYKYKSFCFRCAKNFFVTLLICIEKSSTRVNYC